MLPVPLSVSSPHDPAVIRENVNKARSLVETALRLLDGGNIVDLSALNGRVVVLCEALDGMGKAVAQPLLPLLEQLVADMARMETVLRQRLLSEE